VLLFDNTECMGREVLSFCKSGKINLGVSQSLSCYEQSELF
jgi:hypothetical protein